MASAVPQNSGNTRRVRFGTCTLDLQTRQLFVDGRETHITPKAFELLAVLTENAPRALTKSELIGRLWPNTYVSEDALSHLVADLRTAIGDSARTPKWIRTVHGFGYSFLSEPVEASVPRHSAASLTWANREFRLNDGENIIGRDPDVEVLVSSPLVSRRHARITLSGGEARLEDLGSKNGTLVGQVAITGPHLLRHGETITIGDIEFTFVMTTNMPTVTK